MKVQEENGIRVLRTENGNLLALKDKSVYYNTNYIYLAVNDKSSRYCEVSKEETDEWFKEQERLRLEEEKARELERQQELEQAE